ncbi:MAG: SOS response-associated peptidase family protein [Bdellovibrionales bacterium]|nr:SOS response-associated peptidase family protein [Bdellovibrionales bacterium]
MCFSVQVDKDLKKIAKRFHAEISKQDFDQLQHLQKLEQSMSSEELKIEMGLKRKPSSSLFKEADEHGRIYPNSFAPVIVWENNKRLIKPMRYRVRPAHSKQEIPSKYNVFNARLDSLEKRKTWQSLFMKKHALFPFVRFYEWVENPQGKSQLISFAPENRAIMWAPALYDNWVSADKKIQFASFAIITNDPPPEVAEMGHDRCPIFLNENSIDQWLQPEKNNKQKMYELLKILEPVYFNSQKVS